jgi:hypothetical protein
MGDPWEIHGRSMGDPWMLDSFWRAKIRQRFGKGLDGLGPWRFSNVPWLFSSPEAASASCPAWNKMRRQYTIGPWTSKQGNDKSNDKHIKSSCFLKLGRRLRPTSPLQSQLVIGVVVKVSFQLVRVQRLGSFAQRPEKEFWKIQNTSPFSTAGTALKHVRNMLKRWLSFGLQLKLPCSVFGQDLLGQTPGLETRASTKALKVTRVLSQHVSGWPRPCLQLDSLATALATLATLARLATLLHSDSYFLYLIVSYCIFLYLLVSSCIFLPLARRYAWVAHIVHENVKCWCTYCDIRILTNSANASIRLLMSLPEKKFQEHMLCMWIYVTSFLSNQVKDHLNLSSLTFFSKQDESTKALRIRDLHWQRLKRPSATSRNSTVATRGQQVAKAVYTDLYRSKMIKVVLNTSGTLHVCHVMFYEYVSNPPTDQTDLDIYN